MTRGAEDETGQTTDTPDADTSSAPGWDAIDAAFDRLCPGVDPVHIATLLKWRVGGPDPLDGVSIYPRDGHWHYVSYGMSELFEKESEYPDVSGWGFEFTIRVVRGEHDAADDPPRWPVGLMQNLARYVFDSGNTFAPGHYIGLNSPISGSLETKLRNAAFCLDPELGEIDTPHGGMVFLQIVGLTDDEYDIAQAWSTLKLLDLIAEQWPLLVNDLGRSSVTDLPEAAGRIAAGIARDGSSAGSSYVTQLEWTASAEGARIVLGALAAPRIARSLRGRLPFGRPLSVDTDARRLTFVPGPALAFEAGQGGELTVTVPDVLVDPLIEALVPAAGVRDVAPGLIVEIIPTALSNEAGEVVGTVG